MKDDFSQLCDDFAAFLDARDAAQMAKAHPLEDPFVKAWRKDIARSRARRAREQVANREFDRTLAKSIADLDQMLKATPEARALQQRQRFDRCYGMFKSLLADGKLTALQACALEARFHQVAERL